jgi:hypothetical protein
VQRQVAIAEILEGCTRAENGGHNNSHLRESCFAMRSLVLSLALYGLLATTHAYMQPFKPVGLFGGARLAKFSSPMLRTAPLALRRKGINQAKMTAAATEKFEFQV